MFVFTKLEGDRLVADKHTVVIVVLSILLVGSIGFSLFSMIGGSDPELKTLSKTILKLEEEKEQLEKEKSNLERSKSELESKIARTDGFVKGKEGIKDDRNIYGIEKASPFDHVKSSQIRVMKNKVEINMQNIQWWEIKDTNSMDPLIDIGSVALSIKPKSPDDINLGDVGIYNSKLLRTVIIHRVVKVDSDEKGEFYKFRGDNLKYIDPEDVRFNMVEGVMVGVIY